MAVVVAPGASSPKLHLVRRWVSATIRRGKKSPRRRLRVPLKVVALVELLVVVATPTPARFFPSCLRGLEAVRPSLSVPLVCEWPSRVQLGRMYAEVVDRSVSRRVSTTVGQELTRARQSLAGRNSRARNLVQRQRAPRLICARFCSLSTDDLDCLGTCRVCLVRSPLCRPYVGEGNPRFRDPRTRNDMQSAAAFSLSGGGVRVVRGCKCESSRCHGRRLLLCFRQGDRRTENMMCDCLHEVGVGRLRIKKNLTQYPRRKTLYVLTVYGLID